ncbi:SnoaL-like domain-containing protein [Pedobacter westerhofensis]|uniref:SnoaL-like domain-containing protein n=1 Tax=Pedobacter westerhofensis TaxID=425512 RepID=A0A521FJM4_9SPHI|nr:nuclear transport factor 2 family protein [Pedobacter westerhofensis]SMO96407.1 SnoaL-like domain-containing protein [Pedobacter westerhofensis]
MKENQVLRTLEDRLRDIEDRLEIYSLIAGHPLSADTGAGYYTRQVYVEDSVFDRGPLPGAQGREVIAGFIQKPEHHQAIAGGLAHFTGLPYVEIRGEEAFVTSYLQILTPDITGEERELPNHGFSKGYRIHRVLANRWTLLRTEDGWKIKIRKLIPIEGSTDATDLIKQGLEAFAEKAV